MFDKVCHRCWCCRCFYCSLFVDCFWLPCSVVLLLVLCLGSGCGHCSSCCASTVLVGLCLFCGNSKHHASTMFHFLLICGQVCFHCLCSVLVDHCVLFLRLLFLCLLHCSCCLMFNFVRGLSNAFSCLVVAVKLLYCFARPFWGIHVVTSCCPCTCHGRSFGVERL